MHILRRKTLLFFAKNISLHIQHQNDYGKIYLP